MNTLRRWLMRVCRWCSARMLEKLLPLTLPPGLYHTGTPFQSAGRWYAGNCVRFFQGAIQPIGGWVQRTLTGTAITGTPNAAVSWQTNDGASYLAIGTTTGLFVIASNTQVYDITPSEPPYVEFGAIDKVWQLDVFGSYLVATFNAPSSLAGYSGHGNLYYWAGTVGVRAQNCAEQPFLNTSDTPSLVYGLVVTPERFLVALRGVDPINITATANPFDVDPVGTYSVRRLYWADQEKVSGENNQWIPSATNSAGSFDLATDGAIVCGKATRGQTLIWTTTDLWTMTYIGQPLVYAFQRAGNHCGIISQRAAVVLDTAAYWMGTNKFFAFDGFVRTIPCEVTDYVFGNLNTTYASKVWALANPTFNEVTWFYPTTGNSECDSYVTFNYVEHHWSFGTMARACGVTQQAGSTSGVPVLVTSGGAVYDHETGTARTGQTVYLESGPVQSGDGDQVLRIQRIVPDDRTAGDVTASLYTAMYPDSTETLNGPYTLASPTSVRLTARQVRIRLTEAVASAWRVGLIRLGVIPGGRR